MKVVLKLFYYGLLTIAIKASVNMTILLKVAREIWILKSAASHGAYHLKPSNYDSY